MKELYLHSCSYSIASIEERSRMLGKYLVDNNGTVRGVAGNFGISKSTVHKDITQVLPYVDHALYLKVKEVLEINKRERHIRGGEATKNKYKNERN